MKAVIGMLFIACLIIAVWIASMLPPVQTVAEGRADALRIEAQGRAEAIKADAQIRLMYASMDAADRTAARVATSYSMPWVALMVIVSGFTLLVIVLSVLVLLAYRSRQKELERTRQVQIFGKSYKVIEPGRDIVIQRDHNYRLERV